MPDITMCINNECRKRAQCHRFTAEPNGLYQSYARFKPKDDRIDGVTCDYFINNRFEEKQDDD